MDAFEYNSKTKCMETRLTCPSCSASWNIHSGTNCGWCDYDMKNTAPLDPKIVYNTGKRRKRILAPATCSRF